MIKSLLQLTLRRLGFYEWFKNETFAYDVYSYFKVGRPLTWRGRELRFYRSLLAGGNGPLLIFDIGANRGTKTDTFLKLGAHVVAVEPDEANLKILNGKYHGLRTRPVMIVGKAMSDSARVETYWVAYPGSALNTLSRKWVETLEVNPGKFGVRVDFPVQKTVETTTLSSLMESHGVPRYIKIDVEGHEPQVLRGLQNPVQVVSFEANLPEFKPEAAECIDILCRLSPNGRFNITSCEAYEGLSFKEWKSGPEIAGILETLGETTVEVYWKSGE